MRSNVIAHVDTIAHFSSSFFVLMLFDDLDASLDVKRKTS